MTKDEIILAQQARVEQLREAATLALETIESNAHERRHVRWKLKDALSFHDDLAALRAHDEKLLATTTLAAKDVLAERDKIIALTLERLKYARSKCSGVAWAAVENAISAIDDSCIVKGIVLCDAEPIGYFAYSEMETGGVWEELFGPEYPGATALYAKRTEKK